jgi:hypothetical protein
MSFAVGEAACAGPDAAISTSIDAAHSAWLDFVISVASPQRRRT